jgi:hypothetical protein
LDTRRNGQPPKGQPKHKNDRNALVDIFGKLTFVKIDFFKVDHYS